MSIQALPADAIAQIKSSIAITSLGLVVCELVTNSLDAGAKKVDISVDFSLGGCIVEDDGTGITPVEFSQGGGLGKLYHTSKLNPTYPMHGGRGTFLASLSAMSILTIVSRHHGHRSHNMITMHKSQVVSRQLPAPAQEHLSSFAHGTRVVVRDLFGNMPVRVRFRAVAAENPRNNSRDWHNLNLDIIALLLAWPKDVTVTIRNISSNHSLRIRPSSMDSDTTHERSLYIRRVWSVLSQAGLILPDTKDSWVAVGATTPKFAISGAICLEPCATKHVQFLSLGIHPFTSVDGQSSLHDEVNRMFMNSSFGVDEDLQELDEAEKLRRAIDLRFKGDGFTGKELKGARRGVDRWPMFSLCIQQFDVQTSLNAGDILDDKAGRLINIIDLLQAIIIEFLTTHHFRPKAVRKCRTKGFDSTLPSQINKSHELSLRENNISDNARGERPKRAKTTFDHFGTNIKLPSFCKSSETTNYPFDGWSRIKYGMSPSTSKTSIMPGVDIERPATAPPVPGISNRECPSKPSVALLSKTGKIIRRPFEDVEVPQRRSRSTTSVGARTHVEMVQRQARPVEGEFLTWTNPVNKVISVIDRRTGSTISASRFGTDNSRSLSAIPSRLKIERKKANTIESPWVQSILGSWDNPIFASAELPIPQVSIKEPDAASANLLRGHNHCCSHADIDRAFKETYAGTCSRISRDALANAEVISQVEKKFILVRLTATSGVDMLVLIDQHAADERIRIETLMEEFCTPSLSQISLMPVGCKISTVTLDTALNFEVSVMDIRLLQKHRAQFLYWGIIYEVTTDTSEDGNKARLKPTQLLAVTSLPLGIVERCKLHPSLLIDLIRTEMYRFDDSSSGPQTPLAPTTSWLQRIHNCPQGIIDMLNSRACRSAIMFNDELSKSQCELLVRKLSRCTFPFQCAHGRPSLVPLLEVGALRRMGTLLEAEDGEEFGKEMKRWRQRMR